MYMSALAEMMSANSKQLLSCCSFIRKKSNKLEHVERGLKQRRKLVTHVSN